MHQIKRIVENMKSDKVSNYVIAGLDSYLLNNGKVRLFECSRNHQDTITPHSHRFSFACLVLSGKVANRVWNNCSENNGDLFAVSTLTYNGSIGEHTKKTETHDWFKFTDKVYNSGEIYSMKAHEIHSIQFSRGAQVLFFEGVEITDESLIIEPVVNGVVIPTYKKLDYMFIEETSVTTSLTVLGESE